MGYADSVCSTPLHSRSKVGRRFHLPVEIQPGPIGHHARLTLVSGWNMTEVDAYAQLVEEGLPDFIEIKAVTYCGKSDGSSLTIENSPWHK